MWGMGRSCFWASLGGSASDVELAAEAWEEPSVLHRAGLPRGSRTAASAHGRARFPIAQ